MESRYLRSLSDRLGQHRFVLVYGAGGVAKNLLLLLRGYMDESRIAVVVSKITEENRLEGYQVNQISQFAKLKDQVMVILAVMPKLSKEMRAYAEMLGFQNFMTAEEISEQLYKEIWQGKISRNKIVFSSWSGGGFGGNAKYIALELMKRSHELELVWVVKKEDEKLPERIRGVLYGTYEHYQELGTAHIWVDNEHKNFFTRKRMGQCYIQTWHGGGPLKKIEFDGENLPGSYLDLCEMNSKLEDIMVSPSRFNSGLYRRAFRFEGEILECGYPRNDIFWQDNNCRGNLERMFSLEPEMVIALYAPTFRNFRKKEEDMLDLEQVRKSIEKRFGKKCRILARFHPSDKEAAKNGFGSDGCIDVTSYGDAQELLAAADLLITDYSSVMWDFSLSGKPVFLFHPDLDLYEKERGYYLPFEKMPYIEAFNKEDLCRKIENFDDEGYQKRTRAFVEEYGSFDKGTAAKAVGNRIMNILQESR